MEHFLQARGKIWVKRMLQVCAILLCFQVPLFAQQPGNALNFDGSNDRVVLPPSLSTSLTATSNNGITIEYWFRGTSLLSAVRIESSTSNYIISGKGMQHLISTDGGQNGVSIPNSVLDGKWHHIAMTWQRNTVNGFRSYVDGQIVAQRTSGNVNLPSVTVGGNLGSSSSPNEFFNGSLDEVRIYKTALTQGQIQTEMFSSNSASPLSLLAHYQFNQGVAGSANFGQNLLQDNSGNGRTAALLNFNLIGATSNYIESYAMVAPTVNDATSITSTSFTVSWSAPIVGVVNSYLLDVSTTPDFLNPISGSPFSVAFSSLSRQIDGLISGTYYYRVRANKTSVNLQGSPSNSKSVNIAYTQPGNALAFDGVNDYVNLPSGIVSGLTNTTIESWFLYNGGGNWQRIFDFGSSMSNFMFFSTQPLGNDPRPVFEMNIGGVSQMVRANKPLLTGKWYHMAITINASTNTARLYLNGELSGENTNFTLRPNNLNITNQNWLGRSQFPNDKYLNGKIDEFRIWNTVKSQQEIIENMKSPVSRNSTGLITYYKFDHGIAASPNTGNTILFDSTSFSKHGVLNGFSLTGDASNWVESYSMTIPTATSGSAVTATSFTANWTAPSTGIINKYFLDVATDENFSNLIVGSPFEILGNSTFSKEITGLQNNFNYFYRVRAERTFLTGQGAISNTILVRTASGILPPGNCLSFDGSNDFVTIPSSTGINNRFLNNRITLEGWFLLKSLPTGGAMPALITENYNGAGGANIKFAIYLYQNTLVGGFHNGSIYWTTATYNKALELNKWTHIACTYDQLNVKLYVNGALVATRASSAPLPPGNEDWSIGKRWDYNEYIHGNFDEVRIYNEALTQSEINLDLRDTNAVLPNNLVAHFNFDQGIASGANSSILKLTDKSSSTLYTGNLNNFAMSGSTSNFITSYAMVVPSATAATAVTANGFTANWLAPKHGIIENYLLDISTTSDFSGPISGSPFTISTSTLSHSVSGLTPGTYYYRIRSINSNFANQSAYSNVVTVLVNYDYPGNALHFDGVNDFVTIPKAYDQPQIFTIEAWFKTTAAKGGIVGFGNSAYGGATNYDRFIYLNNNGRIYFGIYNNNQVAISSPLPYNDGKYHHVAASFNYSKGLKLYVDGVLVASTGPVGLAQAYWGYWRIGGFTNWSNAGQFFEGNIDEVKIWSSERTLTQIQDGIKNYINTNQTDLLAYFNFNQGVSGANNSTTDVSFDQSSKGNNGNLMNFSLNGTTSNWVESYSMISPTAIAATSISSSGFTANFTASPTGTVNNYQIEVSTTPDFTGLIPGSPFVVSSTTNTRVFTNMLGGTYYYRVRPIKTNLTGAGAALNSIAVNVPYTIPGNAIAFDGVNDRLKAVNYHIGNFGSSNFTVEFWMKTSASSGYLVTKRITCGHGSFFNISHNSVIAVEVDQDGAGTNYLAMSSTNNKPVNDGKWHHIAVVREGVNIKIYIDGVVEGNKNTNGVTWISNGNSIDIGTRYCHNLPYDGSLDELRIWYTARSQDSIVSNMRKIVSPNSPGLTAYYDFDQGVGGFQNYGRTVAFDKKGNPESHLNLIDFTMEALNSNFVQSYATVVPTQTDPTEITPSGFTLNWLAPPNGEVTNYLVDVSLSSNFTAPISGSPFNVSGLTHTLSGLASSTFYCRVRANIASGPLAGEGGPSNVKVIDLKYTQPGNALHFDGNNDFGLIPKSLTNNFTVEFWMKSGQTGTSKGIISTNDFGVSLSNGKIVFNAPGATLTSSASVNIDRWIHVAVTRNNSQLKLYINGIQDQTATGAAGNINSNLQFTLGSIYGQGSNSTFSYNGAIDELRIWNIERASIDIANFYKDTIDRTTTGLLDYYRFDQGIGGVNNTGVTTLIDISGTNNGGSISNFSLAGNTSNWVNSYSIGVNAPSNLTASNSNCGTIDLNWQLPASRFSNCEASNDCIIGDFKQFIYVDDSLLAEVPGSATNYSFNVNQIYRNTRLIRGINYKFVIRMAYVPTNFNFVRTSQPTNIAIGKFKDNPAIVSGFTASTEKCDGSVTLNWSWNDANPQNGFIINRSNDSIMSSPLQISLAGQQRSYNDAGLQRGHFYYYRIFPRNDCFSASAPDSMFAGVSDTMIITGGISPQVPARPTDVSLFADSINNVISIRWKDNSDNEDKFVIERAAVGGLTTNIDVNANDTFYLDEQAAGCVAYNYTVKAISGCAINGIPSLGVNQTRITPNLNETFNDTTIYKLTCSKGYYQNRVELNWNNRNNAQLSSIRIYRKVANSNNDSILISSVLPGSGLYIDNTVVAGVLYRYFLIGETQCAGVARFSNMTDDIGFRSPTGTVNGRITYLGDYAASGVRVLAQNTTNNKGGAVNLDGVDDYLEIEHNDNQNTISNALTIETWFKPITQNDFVLVSKKDSVNGGYVLKYNSSSNQLIFAVYNNIDSQIVSVDSPFTSFTSYNQITAAFGIDSIRVFVNGIHAKTVATTISSLGIPKAKLYLGGSPELGIYGKGNMDEVRLWNKSKTGLQIVNDFNRKIEQDDASLFLYLNFDDRFNGLTETYDQSNLNLVFNGNHAKLVNGAGFTDSIPNNSQLALASYTDASGNYSIPNLRYIGSGQNYTVVPSLDIHTFSPNNSVIFVGDGNQLVNNVNFIDNSSFEFVGTVNYAGTTCPAVGARVLIDGQFIVQNSQLLTVNDSGKFAVRVPIGAHYVSLVQDKHTFSQGRFPERGLFDFSSPVSVNFVDSTFLTVVGRVAGGKRELSKLPGLARGKNNIGKASFTFNSVGQSGINGCYSQSIVTNDTSGEYTAYLLPLRYNINNLKLVNNADPTILTKPEFNNPNILDLSIIPEVTNVSDTLVTDYFTRIDSISYHKQLDFAYYESPEIFVSDTSTPYLSLVNNFIGEKSIKVNDSTTIDISNNELGYPVFLQGNVYVGIIKVVERYYNADKPSTDSTRVDIVPVNGVLRFFNNFAISDTVGETEIENGVFVYTFKGGVPNQLRNSVNPQYSYTKTMQLEFVPQIGATINYLPNQSDLINKFYRGYLFGARPGGSNFVTRGPALVDFVLRDPPGSASSATWSKGTSYSKAESYSFSNSFTRSISNEIDAGSKVTTFVGAGAGLGAFFVGGTIMENEVIANVNLGVSLGISTSGEGEIVTTTTSNTTISTGSDPSSVGADADIYYGKSINMVFGNADQVELIDTATCAILESTAGTQICYGNEINGYKIGKRNSYFISPGGIATTFAYTQNEILNIVIPDLEALRNQLFTNNTLNNRGQKKYTAVFVDANDADFARKFGSNNDDPIWGANRSTPTPFTRETRDSIGSSYIFRGNSRFETDSIRFYNDQIRLWKSAIAKNEEVKYRTINNAGAQPVVGGRNISIGKAMITEDFSSQTDQSSTETFDLNFSTEIGTTIGFEAFGLGMELTNSFSFEHTTGSSKSSAKSVVNTFSYTLQDGDDGDLISTDIVDPRSGGSHLFKLRSGRTSCPYEGEQRAMFFDPANDTITSTTMLEDGFEIQTGTAQNDVPVISVDRNNNFNVPANDDAIFVLDLGNLSEGRQDRTYSLRVDQSTNPYGAILKVDGLDPNRDFDVPYGATVQKTLTLKRGPNHYDYSNIRLILKSACDDDIFDTVSISAKFLPTCTDISLKSPEDRWVLNTNYRDTLPVVMGGYNYNWGGFQAVHFQYKPLGSSVWYNEKSYFKDTADVNYKIPVGEPNIFYPFNFRNLPDGNYELRAVTECIAPGYPNSRINSTVMQGLVDRINPSPFGTPSPADGILSPNDDISIQFNEPIEQSSLSLSNFEVKGVLNQSDLRSNTSILFDGDNDYLEVAQGLGLQQKSFTIEFWHKRNALGNQVLVSQGADSAASFDIGFTSDNKFFCRIAGETVVSNLPFTDTSAYNFYAVSYNNLAQTADLFINEQVVNIGNNRIFNPYSGSGKFYIGKSAVNNPLFSKGNLYELRVWNIARTLTESVQSKSKLLSGTESGLIANWRMDEATGNMVKDYARFRNASIVNAQWFITPTGKSYTFDGNSDFITVPTQHFGISKEMDFTLEFWFKSNNGNKVGLLSNGTGEGNIFNSNLKWSIETDSIGRIHVRHNGIDFLATNSSHFDGNWHHFALVLRRNSNLSAYIDANLQNSIQSAAVEQWGGLKLWMGARGWNNNGNLHFDSTSNYFTGEMDELRFWNTSRLHEQIQRDKNSRLNGDEAGLVLYVPFEAYTLQQGFPVLTASSREFTSDTRTITSFGDATFSFLSPTIKLPRAAQNINFTYSLNDDKIIITPTIANEFIENVTLDITVKNIKDKNGNTQQSPKTWIAYVDKNQVKWQDDNKVLSKNTGAPLSFNATIINSGGALKTFTISNLPEWLKSSVTKATINPNSVVDVTFTVDPNLNIGKYEHDLALSTDFGYADKMIINLNVNAIKPTWDVKKGEFSKSMSIIGQVRINNVISANTEDILAAFVGNDCRGLAKVQYFEQLDKYLVFMDVYGNTDNEVLEFRIWNSATGKTHIQVNPSLNFVSNNVVGTVASPQIFNALDKVTQRIPLNTGWNWISFNLLSTDSTNLNQLFAGLRNFSGNQIKNNTQMASYDSINGWTGNLSNLNTGIKPESSYLMYVNERDTLEVRGVEANPVNRTISINAGWNFLGFIAQRNLSTNEALSDLDASQNDIIKGQTNFAVYDTVLGWIGSLSTLIPNEGYLYKSANSQSFNYPLNAMFGKKAQTRDEFVSKYWTLKPGKSNTTMSLLAKVNACSNLNNKDQLLLGAFVNNELRGFAKAQIVNGKENIYFLSIEGLENETLSFKLLDENSGLVYDLKQTIDFKSNLISGSLKSPFVFENTGSCTQNNVEQNFSAVVYPIPFSDEFNISLNMPESANVTLRILDISGKEIELIGTQQLNKGVNIINQHAAQLPSGVYLLEVQSSLGTSRQKIVKL
ncbi:MAG: LamG-like jellyroll fold domain-containing protein [Bacteroidia bacterium]